jgi:hypothetical protein
MRLPNCRALIVINGSIQQIRIGEVVILQPMLACEGREMAPQVNDPRVIGREERFVSINSTLEVDFLGQCNSEVLNGRYWSGSGGQADFARGAMHSPEGQGFVVLHSARWPTSRRASLRSAPPRSALICEVI